MKYEYANVTTSSDKPYACIFAISKLLELFEIEKSLSDKSKLYIEEKTCRHCSGHKCVKEDEFNAFYEDYIECKDYINDILNNKFQPDNLHDLEKTTNKTLCK